MSKYGVISGPCFPAFGLNKYLSVFSPNVGKYGAEKTPYLDTFYAVIFIKPVKSFPILNEFAEANALGRSNFQILLSVISYEQSFR